MTRNTLFVIGLVAAVCVGFRAGRISPVDVSPGTTAEAGLSSNASLVDNSSSTEALPEPVIGIASLTNDSYVRAIRQCGGIPVVLPNADGSPETIDEYLELLDGLLMPGGADIPPSEWSEEQHPTTNLLDD